MNEGKFKADGVFREKSDSEIEFVGFLSDPDGNHLGTISRTFPRSVLISPRKRRGRHKDEPKHVAVAGHMAMLSPISRGEISDARVQVAMLLCVGNAGGKRGPAIPENQDRQIRDHIKKAHDSLQGSKVVLPVNVAEKDRFIAYFEPSAKVEHGENRLRIDGHGWLVRWGDRVAEYGRIEFTLSEIK